MYRLKQSASSRWVLALILMIVFTLQGASAPAVRAQSFPVRARLPYLAQPAPPPPTPAPVYHYRIVNTYQHDPLMYTEGLFYQGGYMYEATGAQYRQSEVRKWVLNTGQVVQDVVLPKGPYGEGIAPFGSKIYELTWTDHVFYNYDITTLSQTGPFPYTPRTEGWGLTQDGVHLIMSDGTSTIYFRDPANFDNVTGTISVNDAGTPVTQLNELEYINGQIWANVWLTDQIAVISPQDGHVIEWIDLTGLRALQGAPVLSNQDAVLNGIAWDPAGHLYVTGKLWPNLYEIQVIP